MDDLEGQAPADAGVDPAYVSRQDEIIQGIPAVLLASFMERHPHLTDRVLELRAEAFTQA